MRMHQHPLRWGLVCITFNILKSFKNSSIQITFWPFDSYEQDFIVIMEKKKRKSFVKHVKSIPVALFEFEQF